MPALGGTPRRIAKEGNFPSWSPDGTKIVFARNRIGLFEVAASGGDVREIKLPNAPRANYYPAYSSDARWVFFEDPTNGISAVPVTGGAVQQIATGRHPIWDASSQAVIYSDSREGNNHSLWSVPFSTKEGKPSGTPRALTIGRGRDWQAAVSKDGKLVAFTAIPGRLQPGIRSVRRGSGPRPRLSTHVDDGQSSQLFHALLSGWSISRL